MKQSIIFRALMMSLLILSCQVCFTSCDDDDGPSASSLTGVWEAQWWDGEVFVYEFNADGAGSAYFKGDGHRHDYFDAYKIDNGHLLLHWYDNDADDWDDKGLIQVSGDTFKLYLYCSEPDEDELLIFRKVAEK